MNNQKTDRLLSAWFELEAPASAPDGLRTDIYRATAAIRPRPAWLARLGGHHMDVITGGARRRETRLIPVLALLLLVLALVAAVAFVGSRRGPDPLVVAPSPSPTTPAASPETNSPSAASTSSPLADDTTALPYNIVEIIPGDDAMWVSTAGEDTNELARAIYRVDPSTGEATLVVSDIGAGPSDHVVFVESQGSIWAAVETQRMLRFDASTGARLGEIPVGDFPIEPLAGLGAVWSENYDDGSVTRIDPATGDVVATIVIPQFTGSGPRDLAIGSSLLWAVKPGGNTMVGIDPATNRVERRVDLEPVLHCGVHVLTGRIWVEPCTPTDPTEVYDEATGTPQGTYEGRMPIYDDGRFVWIPGGDEDSTTLVKFDPLVLRKTQPIRDLGVPTSYLTAGHGSIWFSNGPNLYRLSMDALSGA